MARSALGRLEDLLKRLVGPAQLGRHDAPTERLRREAASSRDAHAQAWETVVDSSGRRYVRARRGGPEDRAGDGPARPAVGPAHDAPPKADDAGPVGPIGEPRR